MEFHTLYPYQIYDGNPAAIHALFETVVIEDEFTLEVISIDTVLPNQIHYRRDSIPSPLITDIKVVDQELTKIIAQDPKAVYWFSSRKFEELVAEVFDKMGYAVALTQATRDGGSDLYLLENKGFR